MCKPLHYWATFSAILLQICCCVQDHCPVALPIQTDALTFCIKRSSWLTSWLQGPMAAKQAHHHAWLLVWGVCADMLFSIHQMCWSPLWPHISSWDLSVQGTFFQKSCGFFGCKFAGLSCADSGFLLTPIPNMSYLSFIIILSWAKNLAKNLMC